MKGFLVKYKRAFLFSLVFSLVCFGFMLTHFTITIDEETPVRKIGRAHV